MCRYTTNMDRSKVIAPLDNHRHSRLMKLGDICGIGTMTSQFMGRRPIPELTDHRILGLKSLYVVGCFQHPRCAVTPGGRATAMKMLMDWKINLRKAFVSL